MFWSKQFEWGRESIEDDLHSGWPVEASSKEMCQKVEDLILQDRLIKVIVIAHVCIFKVLGHVNISDHWRPL